MKRQHPYSVKIAGNDDENNVNNVNINKMKDKSVNKSMGTRSKMAAGTAINNSGILNTHLGDRCISVTHNFL